MGSIEARVSTTDIRPTAPTISKRWIFPNLFKEAQPILALRQLRALPLEITMF